MSDTSTETVERMAARVEGGLIGDPQAAATLRALAAERDSLARQLEAARQIERNVQAIREQEFQRAEKALARSAAMEKALVIVTAELQRATEYGWQPGEDALERACAAADGKGG